MAEVQQTQSPRQRRDDSVTCKSISTRSSLQESLSALPAPANDFEVIVPDHDPDLGDEAVTGQNQVEDQSDIDARREAEAEARRLAELSRRSQAVQRDMPRPHTINKSVLRPPDVHYTDLQKAEELIKREMVVMLHYDALHSPTASAAGKKSSQDAAHADYLHSHPYRSYSEHELALAKKMLSKEIQVVKQGMNHGDLTSEAYSQVWEECLAQVLFLPSQSKYTRASLASKKDRIESLEKRLDQNRAHMAQQAKRAAKLEKKLKILLGGYMARAATLTASLSETQHQVENARLELSTFKFLQELEAVAVPRRLSTLQEDVERQKERERELQSRYQTLTNALDDLKLAYDEKEEKPFEMKDKERSDMNDEEEEEEQEKTDVPDNKITHMDVDDRPSGNERLEILNGQEDSQISNDSTSISSKENDSDDDEASNSPQHANQNGWKKPDPRQSEDDEGDDNDGNKSDASE
ncbi:Pre-mRNA splicing factor component Cdc5p/Cef1 [Trinorchestia longiramus]|nr:Pre-mRNA splicing factor component Cdc5p/Cef1 [Trinorchestia longiramus]